MTQAPERLSTTRAGLDRPWSRRDAGVPRLVVQPLQRFLQTEAAGGALLLVAAVVALVWANSSWSGTYERVWELPVTFSVGGWTFAEDLRHVINDVLMALFFFVVGLEIKREMVHGSLRDRRGALLPVAAAAGGMLVPAVIYAAFNRGGPAVAGWGIPMATDIAFAVGVLLLLGRRVHPALKIFLLTLAVADDVGAILVVAVFYPGSGGIRPLWVLASVLVVLAVVGLQRMKVRSLAPYVVLGGLLWALMALSGVHATIAGVVLGLLTPAWPFHPPEAVTSVIGAELRTLTASPPDGRADEWEQVSLMDIAGLAQEAVSPLERLVSRLHPWTAFVVLPLFALANAGVSLRGMALTDTVNNPITQGVVAGLVLGKPLGIVAATWLTVRSGLGRLPAGVRWPALTGVAAVGGVGFTVALFVAGLAFGTTPAASAAKLGILLASLLAGLLGAAVILLTTRRRPDPI